VIAPEADVDGVAGIEGDLVEAEERWSNAH
jgi:hypothetical protein